MSHDGLFNARFDAIVRDLADTEDGTEAPETATLVPAAPALPPSPLDEQDPVTPLAPLPPLTGVVHPGGGTPTETKRSTASRARSWIVSRTGIQTTAVTLGAPSAVWVLAEVSAAQAAGWTGFGSGVLIVGGGALGVWSLSKNLGDAVTVTGLGAATVGLQTALAVAPSAWAGFIGWALGALGAGAARVAYANGRKKPEAEVRILAAEAQRREAAVLTEQFKAQAMLHRAQLEQLKVHAALTAAAPVAVEHHGLPYMPTLRGDETGAETALMYALTPGRWADMAKERGLEGTAVIRCALTDAGIEADIRLDGRWDHSKLAAQEGPIRAMASIETATRVHIGPGPRGDVARILIRTRSASDGLSLAWEPGRPGVGVDEITGEIVDIPLRPGNHVLVAGMTGMGKSVSWRPLAMRAAGDPLWAVILLDPKRQEAGQWSGKIRTVGDQDGTNDEIRQLIYDTVREIVGEMLHRQRIAPGATWVPTTKYPELLVIIEEGRQLIEMDKDPRWSGVLAMVDDLYTLARAVGIQLLWATQYPSRTNGGITAMVDENTATTLALTVSGSTSDRVIFGETAGATGWEPSTLDGIPGRCMVKATGRTPNPVRVWFVADEVVRALPDAAPWHSAVAAPAAPPAAGDPEEGLTENQRAVLAAVRAGHAGPSDIERATGINKGSVKRSMDRLEALGLI
ncbi:hypothetical protein ACFUT3_01415 [Streptomyces cinereoruber]|uniref:MarR family transcriptional regulator n=1 Tax=Streptomyces cinereoruber TaxID=67260 RepID=UPI0036324E77